MARQLFFMALAVAAVTACTQIIDDELPAPPAPAATALYRVTFEATWSAATHPGSYPADAHFSPLLGASHKHDADSRLFRTMFPASPGIKNMAEIGNNAVLRAILDDMGLSLADRGEIFSGTACRAYGVALP